MKPISNEDVSHQLEAEKDEDASSLSKRKNSDDKTVDINKTVKRLRLYVVSNLISIQNWFKTEKNEMKIRIHNYTYTHR